MGLEKLNEFKKIKGLTNLQLSQMTGITLSTIDKITSGNNTNPKLNTIKALCQALDCTLDDLLDDVNYSDNQKQKKYKEENRLNNAQSEDSNLLIGEKKHIKKYRTLDSYGKEAVDNILDIEYRRCTEQQWNRQKKDQVLSPVAARSEGNKTKIHTEYTQDLSKYTPDDSDL